MTTASESIALALATKIAGLNPKQITATARERAQELVLDISGLCLAARHTDYIQALRASWPAAGRCTAIGHTDTVDAAAAAMINGTAAHGEDFDDTFEGGPVHAGAVVVPAVLATCEQYARDGRAALLGIIVGTEVMCRLSMVAPKAVHRAGFHPTGIFGAPGAAAAVGATLGLNEKQLMHAFGIVGSMASGIIEYLSDGSSTKRMHPGWAAQAGIRAALMARHGFSGPRLVFEGTHGLFNGFAHTRDGDFGALTRNFGDGWLMETIAFKLYACGTMIHPYLDCALRLAHQGIKLDDIVEIRCQVAEDTVHRLWEPLALKQRPPNAYAAKFSAPFCVAAAFITGDAGLKTFSDDTVNDARIQALAAKVRFDVDPANPYPRNYTGHVRLQLNNGRVIEERQPHLRGGAHERLSRADLEAKFVRNAAFGGWSQGRASAFAKNVRTLFDGSIDLSSLRA